MSTFRKFDWLLLLSVVLLGCMGLVALLSINAAYFWRQLLWWVPALAVILAGAYIRWDWLLTQRWLRTALYGGGVFLLIVPFLLGTTVKGTHSWIVLGEFRFEPSELMKIALIVVLASFFSRRHLAAWHGKNILISLWYTLLPVGIIALQPDMGSGLVLIGIWAGFLLTSGVNKKRLIAGLLLVAVAAGLMWLFVLHDYQRERIAGFLFPERDPLGVNYNVVQSKIAIGSAGLFGKGFGKGTQTQLGFLPEARTDFIFASFTEEWGLLGAFLFIGVYGFMLARIIHIGMNASRNDLKFVCLGSGLFFLVHFFVNIGSATGLIPVIGISLPFASYGGSNLLTAALLMSMIERIRVTSL